MDVRVDRVAAPTTYPLRQRVLRPHQTLDQLALPGDDDPETAHFAALDEAGAVVGTASVRREAPAWDPADVRAWRLRGMATDEDRRRSGVGQRVLAAAVAHVGDRGGGVLWCHARLGAVPFYEHCGFVVHGEPFEEPDIGPHVAMWRLVPGSAAAQP